MSSFALCASFQPSFVDYHEVTGLLAYILDGPFPLQDADNQSLNRGLQGWFEDEQSLRPESELSSGSEDELWSDTEFEVSSGPEFEVSSGSEDEEDHWI